MAGLREETDPPEAEKVAHRGGGSGYEDQASSNLWLALLIFFVHHEEEISKGFPERGPILGAYAPLV